MSNHVRISFDEFIKANINRIQKLEFIINDVLKLIEEDKSNTVKVILMNLSDLLKDIIKNEKQLQKMLGYIGVDESNTKSIGSLQYKRLQSEDIFQEKIIFIENNRVSNSQTVLRNIEGNIIGLGT